jgi:CRP-like cAMP-binding protein
MLSLNRAIVTIPGAASVIESHHLVEVAESRPKLRRIVLKYEQFLMAQVQQTAACNALHDIEKRTCRWLLRMCDLRSQAPWSYRILFQ